MSKVANYMGMSIVEPQARIKHLANYGNMIEVDPNMPVQRYFRSGTEILRMANVYLTEGNHENAYILYIKFMTLFIEKIRTHPDYNSVPAAVKQPIRVKLKEIIPVTEKLKDKLLVRYQKEYEQFLANKEAEKARELEREKQRLQQEQKDKSNRGGSMPMGLQVQINSKVQPSAPDLSLLDQVVYPNDFPSGTGGRSNLPSSGLLLPDSDKKPVKPIFDRSQKPSNESSESLLASGSLRTVVIPHNTMSLFLSLASKNTANNVETCGILAGRLAHNRLLITHVIIPKQQGTADSCNTMKEEEIFDVQDQQNLITLGWIHTHPSQTAFLSSVDLHTHCSYQMMMPEAIAIVCAPKYQASGFFCLTPNYGLDYIAQCRQAGFHPHPNDPPLFMDATHIHVDEHLSVEFVDLRR
ncbi:STAM-binding protein [Episyrphus balteatus]|uniref:STAM-binding protein n=1 Tax=Episyrphus balteatus TaxID=286459 RepID=UPI0024867D26|nr:STAM-binding protein [Episyrphus balteatus]